jgi:hypothetical protein
MCNKTADTLAFSEENNTPASWMLMIADVKKTHATNNGPYAGETNNR